MEVQSNCKHHATFGVGFKVRNNRQHRPKWLPSLNAVLRHTQQQVRKVKETAQGKVDHYQPTTITHETTQVQDSPVQCCHVGHDSTSATSKGKLRWNHNTPWSFWPGILPGNVILCSACYQRAYRLARQKKIIPLPGYLPGFPRSGHDDADPYPEVPIQVTAGAPRTMDTVTS